MITEYADFECPACQTFDVVQFPDVRRQLIETGKVRWRYRDFPLDNVHPFARRRRPFGRLRQRPGPLLGSSTPALPGPGAPGRGEIRPVGHASGTTRSRWALDLTAYDACMKSAKYAGRIQASYDEGIRVGVSSTPTFLIGGRLYEGVQNSDAIKKRRRLAGSRGGDSSMNRRMGVALLSVAGLLISAYLWMFKHGYIGTLACGTGGCETVQLSPYSSFLGVDVALLGFLGYAVFLGGESRGNPAGVARARRAARACCCSWRAARCSSRPT